METAIPETIEDMIKRRFTIFIQIMEADRLNEILDRLYEENAIPISVNSMCTIFNTYTGEIELWSKESDECTAFFKAARTIAYYETRELPSKIASAYLDLTAQNKALADKIRALKEARAE